MPSHCAGMFVMTLNGETMSDLTIEQLEAMQETITPGERYLHEDDWDGLMIVNDAGRHMTFGDQLRVKVEAGHPERDGESIVAIPKLIEALIAEKRARQKLRSEVEAMKSKSNSPSPHDDYVYAQGWEYALDLVDADLTRILGADNG